MAEPLLARLDLATLALGWLDGQTGAFRLNRQRGLAEDTGLSECCVSRTLTALESAGYLRRRVRRIFKHGKHWVSRWTIHVRPRFFIDLGLGHQLAEERTRKKAKRDKVLAALGMQKSRDRLQAVVDKGQRKASHLAANKARAAQEAERAEQLRQDRERARAAAWASFAADPDVQALPRRKQIALFGQRFPDLI
jgi:DNA-binding transcriptional MocR family regulator